MSSSEEFKTFIRTSQLAEEDKKLWEEILNSINDSSANLLIEFVNQDFENLEFLTKNIKQKMEALKTDGPNLINQILEEEKQYLDQI